MSARSFFARRQTALKLAATLYVFLLIASHSSLPSAHVWLIAGVFSVVMNGVYITEALSRGQHVRTEAAVAGILVAVSLLGMFVWPPFVIAAVFGHGLWDLAKHRGAGISFFSWYTFSCCGVDMLYGASLLVYWLFHT